MPGFVPAAEVLLFRQKDPKPLTAPFGLIKKRRTQGTCGRANSRCSNKARQLMRAFAPGARRQASDTAKREGYEGAC